MSKEHKTKALEQFYIHKKIPALTKELYLTAENPQKGSQRESRLIASELNYLIDRVYREDADYFPHYRIATSPPFVVEQYLPFIENSRNQHQDLNNPYSELELSIGFSLDTSEKFLHQIDDESQIFFDSTVAHTMDDDEVYESEYLDFETEEDEDRDWDEEDYEEGSLLVAWDHAVAEGEIRVEFDLYEGGETRNLSLPFTNQNVLFLRELTKNLTLQGADVIAVFSYQDYMNGFVMPHLPGHPDMPINPLLN